MKRINKYGFSILELITTVFICGLILIALIHQDIARINQARFVKTIHELQAIAEACNNYYLSKGAWPDSIAKLVPDFLVSSNLESPFATGYQLHFSENLATVSVHVPAGIAQNLNEGLLLTVTHEGQEDEVAVTKILANDFTSRLEMQSKYGT